MSASFLPLATPSLISAAEGVSRIQSQIGDYFAPAQGGSMYTSAAVAAFMAWLRAQGPAGVRKQVEASMRVTGAITIAADGTAYAITDNDGIAGIAHYRWQHIAALCINQGFGFAATHCGDQRVGGTQVNTGRQLVLMRRSALSGLCDL